MIITCATYLNVQQDEQRRYNVMLWHILTNSVAVQTSKHYTFWVGL
jgi:hypothetical protein